MRRSVILGLILVPLVVLALFLFLQPALQGQTPAAVSQSLARIDSAGQDAGQFPIWLVVLAALPSGIGAGLMLAASGATRRSG
jgi:hypothetical protein